MQYLVERDLFMTKLEKFLNEKTDEGYKLEKIFVSQFDSIADDYRASKVTVILYKED